MLLSYSPYNSSVRVSIYFDSSLNRMNRGTYYTECTTMSFIKFLELSEEEEIHLKYSELT